jgi:hypothetical protein
MNATQKIGHAYHATISATDLTAIIQSIDDEIDRLQQGRALLTGHTPQVKRDFPPKSKPILLVSNPKSLKRGTPSSEPDRKRKLVSEEGRPRMAAAQRSRWAKSRAL